ncbi:unnamed protein product [Phytophthora lilii]|uniref:Unnamed protein product n=1 Tax=Phytophthora lilii TaxID=2077276 RepID=A0A9W6TAS6_9STRA|nr:unnamed protein product [Phytophthora lilii]
MAQHLQTTSVSWCLCPSYQSPDRGYLNAHCVFVPENYLPTSSSNSGSSSSRRFLTSVNSTSASNSAFFETSSGSSSEVSTVTTIINDVDATYTVKINKENVTGQFVCLQLSDCKDLAADTSTCYPSTCGSSDFQEQCNYQGTCTYKNKKTITKRSCMCYLALKATSVRRRCQAHAISTAALEVTASMAIVYARKASMAKSMTARRATRLNAATTAQTT